MSTVTKYTNKTWYWRDGSKRTDTATFAIGRTSSGTNVYYAIAEFDLASELAGKTIKSVKYGVKSNADGNSTDCPAGVFISKYNTWDTCISAMKTPNGTNTIKDADTTNYVEFDCTANAYVLQNTGTSYVILGHTTTTNSTYKVLYGSSAAEGNRPYLKIEFQDGTVKYYTGTAWQTCEVNYHNGTSWVKCKPYYHDGTGWKECGV